MSGRGRELVGGREEWGSLGRWGERVAGVAVRWLGRRSRVCAGDRPRGRAECRGRVAGPQGLLGAGSLARVVWGRGLGAGAEPEGRKRTEPGVPQAARNGRSGPPAPAAMSGAPGWRAAGRRALGRSAESRALHARHDRGYPGAPRLLAFSVFPAAQVGGRRRRRDSLMPSPKLPPSSPRLASCATMGNHGVVTPFSKPFQTSAPISSRFL